MVQKLERQDSSCDINLATASTSLLWLFRFAGGLGVGGVGFLAVIGGR